LHFTNTHKSFVVSDNTHAEALIYLKMLNQKFDVYHNCLICEKVFLPVWFLLKSTLIAITEATQR